jgi:plastocyanin
MKTLRILVPLAAVLLATLAVACGGGYSSADKTSTASAGSRPSGAGGGVATTTATATTGANATPATTSASSGAQKQMSITAKDFSFSAQDVQVSKGDTITVNFKNNGPSPHTLTFYTDDSYTNKIAGGDTGTVAAGDTTTLTVKAEDGLYYRCNIHPTQMQGEIEFAQ